MKKNLVLTVAAMCFVSVTAFAQGFAPSPKVPDADGVVGIDEYASTTSYRDMKLSTSLSQDGKTFYMALEAPSTGWVAVGLGSLRMNGAYMVFGYDDNGKTVISEETGMGHSHSTNASAKLIARAVKETNKITVLEFALPAADFLTGNTLKMLLAYGRRDNLTSFHANFTSFELSVRK